MVRPSSPPAHNLAQPVKLSAAQPRRSGAQPPSHRAVRAVSRSPGEAEQAPAPKPALLSVTGSKPGTTAAGSAPCSNTCRRSNGRTTTVTPPKPWPHQQQCLARGGNSMLRHVADQPVSRRLAPPASHSLSWSPLTAISGLTTTRVSSTVSTNPSQIAISVVVAP